MKYPSLIHSWVIVTIWENLPKFGNANYELPEEACYGYASVVKVIFRYPPPLGITPINCERQNRQLEINSKHPLSKQACFTKVTIVLYVARCCCKLCNRYNKTWSMYLGCVTGQLYSARVELHTASHLVCM